jgi:cleavage and polyadenylation specificity factor subunit 3
MARLKSALMSKYSSQRDRVKIYNPRNCDELRLYFKGEKIAKVAIPKVWLTIGDGLTS